MVSSVRTDPSGEHEENRVEGPLRSSAAWLGPTSYWQPEHLVESAWHEHAPFASWLVDTARPRILAELGTHNGFSFFVFCEAAKRLGLATQCFALDTWQGDEHAGFYGAEVFDSVTTRAETDYAGSAHLLRGYFSESVSSFADGSIDILHIDGRHRYEDAREDFATYLPKLSDRALVLFHDTMEREHGFEVWRLWAELADQYPDSSFEFRHGHGLGVLGVGNRLPAALSDFFASTAAHGAEIREAYSLLGSKVARSYEDGKLTAANNELERLLTESVNRAQILEESIQSSIDRFDDLSLRQQELLASTSWQVTAPLRWVKTRISRR